MNSLKNIFKAVTGNLWGYGAAVLFGVAIGTGIAGYVQGLRVDAERARAEVAEANQKTEKQAKETAQGDLSACQAASSKQNDAVAEMKERAERAEKAIEKANDGRTAAEKRAADILRQRTPAGVDKCTAARNAFADELRKERGQ